MRPEGPELLLGLQRNLLSVILPHATDPFIQGQIGTMAMILGQVAADWDNAVPTARASIRRLEAILRDAAPVLARAGSSQAMADSLTSLAAAGVESDSLADLRERRRALDQGLADMLVACEAIVARGADAEVERVRRAGYAYLNDDLNARYATMPRG